tara:strand:- start:508 stop:792 length:285 start_codon:yes stop_codon:yes gene_type:complete
MEDVRNIANKINLNVGDLLVDSLIGTIGIIMEPEDDHHIAGYYYKSKFWKIFWVSTNEDYSCFTGHTYVEEYGLKMSIAIGIYDYHPTIKQEKI